MFEMLNVSKWKSVIKRKEVERVGLNEWKSGMEKRKLWDGTKKRRNRSTKDGRMEAWEAISYSEPGPSVWM